MTSMGAGSAETAALAVSARATYRIFVDGYTAGDQGPYTLTLELQ